VKAQVHTLGVFSAHVGQTDLLGWLDVMGASRSRFLLTHVEDAPRQALADAIQRRIQLPVLLPALKAAIEI